VPVDDNVASLVRELQHAARGARVDFRSLQLASGSSASSTSPAGGAQRSGGSSASGSNATAGAASAPATQAAAAALPPGAAVGPAGLSTMPFKFTFDGSYLDMQHMLAAVNRSVSVRGADVSVRGRLLSIDGIALQPATERFPKVTASIAATAYPRPPDQDPAGGATPPAPASGAQSASTGASPPPPASVAGVNR
jgi:hypothetical protein